MMSRYQQRKRMYTNVLMFVGLMAMAMVAWLDHQNRLPQRRPSAQASAPAVDRISFTSSNQSLLSFVRNADTWQLLSPVQTPARSGRVTRLLELYQTDFSAGYDAAEVNLAAAGLQDAERTISFDDTTFHFGQIEAVSGRRYVQRDQRVLIMEDRYLPLMDGGINAFADLSLPYANTTRVRIGDKAVDDTTLLAWQKMHAIGVRQSTEAHASATPVIIGDTETQPWMAWPDRGLWVLQPPGLALEYLISAAHAATLGLSH